MLSSDIVKDISSGFIWPQAFVLLSRKKIAKTSHVCLFTVAHHFIFNLFLIDSVINSVNFLIIVSGPSF